MFVLWKKAVNPQKKSVMLGAIKQILVNWARKKAVLLELANTEG